MSRAATRLARAHRCVALARARRDAALSAAAACRSSSPARPAARRARRHRPPHHRRAGRRRRRSSSRSRRTASDRWRRPASTSTSRATTASCCSPARCRRRRLAEIGNLAKTHRQGAQSCTTSSSSRPTTDLRARTNDTYITSKVKARFVEANKFPPNAVKVVTERGVVYLMGIVTPAGGRRGRARSPPRPTGVARSSRSSSTRAERADAGSDRDPAPRYPAKIATPTTRSRASRALAAAAGDDQRRVRHPASRARRLSRAGARARRSLVVAVNSDASVKRLGKGDDRPLNTLDDRMAVLAALAASTSSCRSTTTRRATSSSRRCPTCSSRAATTRRDDGGRGGSDRHGGASSRSRSRTTARRRRSSTGSARRLIIRPRSMRRIRRSRSRRPRTQLPAADPAHEEDAERHAVGQVVQILATDPASVRDFQAFARQTGNELVEHGERDGAF